MAEVTASATDPRTPAGEAEIVERAGRCLFYAAGIRELSTHLAAEEGVLETILLDRLAARDAVVFSNLLVAALASGHRVNARLLAEGAALLPDLDALAAVAGHCDGDVARALLDAVRSERMGPDFDAAALLVAAFWCQRERGGELEPGLVTQARVLARQPLGELPLALLLALAGEVDDPGLWAALRKVDDPGVAGLAEHAGRLQREAFSGEVLAALPKERPSQVISGYTMRRAVPRIGRNEPCPCGSGKKYKKCCFAKDRERLRDSSPVPGLTRRELQEHPETYLDVERLHELERYDLVRLEASKVPPDLHAHLIRLLASYREGEALVRFLEALGFREELDDSVCRAINLFATRGFSSIARRLLSWRGAERSDETLCLGARILKRELEPGPLLEMIEEEALQVVDSEEELWTFSLGLLSSPTPALGLLVARGVVPLLEGLGAELLAERLLETRDRLGLEPVDPIELVVGRLDEDSLDEEEEDSPEVVAAHARFHEKNLELGKLRNELSRVRAELAAKERAYAEPPAKPPPSRSPASNGAPEVEKELMRRVTTLKSELKERHSERNQLRRDLESVRAEMETLRATADDEAAHVENEGAAAEEALAQEAEALEGQPVRLPVFPRGFAGVLRELPEPTARGAVRLVGRLAAGEELAFCGARRLRAHREIWRQRLGRDYRLLFRLDPQNLTVLALAHRQDLERTIKNWG